MRFTYFVPRNFDFHAARSERHTRSADSGRFQMTAAGTAAIPVMASLTGNAAILAAH